MLKGRSEVTEQKILTHYFKIRSLGKVFLNAPFKKSWIITLQSLYSSIKIGEEKFIIDPLTPFLRLVKMVDRKSKEDIENYFECELNPYPVSLFKHGCMRSTGKVHAIECKC